jgi:hypothetical protein
MPLNTENLIFFFLLLGCYETFHHSNYGEFFLLPQVMMKFLLLIWNIIHFVYKVYTIDRSSISAANGVGHLVQHKFINFFFASKKFIILLANLFVLDNIYSIKMQ